MPENDLEYQLARANRLLSWAEGLIFEGVRPDALKVTGCETWKELEDEADEIRWEILGHLGIAVIDRREYFESL